jgi:hypothetical protein
MAYHQPFQVTGFHSCDRKVGLQVLNGEIDLIPSDNEWDWLGGGVYFWEQNPERALQYAVESANGNQKNKIPIKVPFVIGSTIELGNCLNLLEPKSIEIIRKSHAALKELYALAKAEMPKNHKARRLLDCAVIKYVHEIAKRNGDLPYDSIRCAFSEGKEVYDGSNFSERGHIEICVINQNMIKGYFLPRPLDLFNPHLKGEFIPKPKTKGPPSEQSADGRDDVMTITASAS